MTDPTSDLLTEAEHAALDTTTILARQLRDILGAGPTASADWAEVVHEVHVIQNRIMSQAAARAYPDRYRLMGATLAPSVIAARVQAEAEADELASRRRHPAARPTVEVGYLGCPCGEKGCPGDAGPEAARKMHPSSACQRGPAGWHCTRGLGHVGPCALWPSDGREL